MDTVQHVKKLEDIITGLNVHVYVTPVSMDDDDIQTMMKHLPLDPEKQFAYVISWRDLPLDKDGHPTFYWEGLNPVDIDLWEVGELRNSSEVINRYRIKIGNQ